MALFKMNPMWSGDPEMCVVAGSYVFTNPAAATANTVVQPALFRATPNALGAAIGQNETMAPQGSKVPCVIFPTTGYAPGVASNAGLANICMLDLRAYPSDIVSVQAELIPAPSATPGALNVTGLDAAVLGIDQSNNFIYILGLTAAGAGSNFAAGSALHFVVYFKDGFAP